jgi:hypothetical protein
MNSKLSEEERLHFSDRLVRTLEARRLPSSPTEFSALFNLRADGAIVTVHGARKWLVGEAIPTQERIQVLADWLGVTAAWLRYGDADNGDVALAARTPNDIDDVELALVKDMRLLSPGHRTVVRELVDSLMRNEHDADHRGQRKPGRP